MNFCFFINLVPPIISFRFLFRLKAIIGLSLKIVACFLFVCKVSQFFSIVSLIAGSLYVVKGGGEF